MASPGTKASKNPSGARLSCQGTRRAIVASDADISPREASPAAGDRGLTALMNPSAVAIVGASGDPTRIGGRAFKYYREFGFRGALYPVNSASPEVQGCKAYESLSAIPGGIDLAVIALPAPLVAGCLAEAAGKGAGAAIIFSSGFAETGVEGRQAQARLVALAKAKGMRLLGPNCLGMFDAETGHCPTFTSFLETGPALPGKLAFLTQSGAYGAHLLTLARRRGVGVRLWVSTGNEADIGLAECLDHAVEHPEIDAIVVYAESIRDGGHFLAALDRARAMGKPIAMIKVGRSRAGAAAAAAHTASFTGADDVFDAALRQYGVARAETTEDLLDLAYVMHRGHWPKGNRLGIFTVSGGAGVLMADAAERHGFDLPPLPAAAQAKLEALVPFGAARNPVDVTAQVSNDMDLLRAGLEVMLEHGGYDLVAAFLMSWPGSPSMGPRLRAALQATAARFPDRLVVLCAVAPPEILDAYERAGFLVFEDPSRLIAAMAAARDLVRRSGAGRRATGSLPGALAIPASAPDEVVAKRLLGSAGLAAPAEWLVTSAAEASYAAAAAGGPVALKIVSPDIPHKTDVGGVALELTTPKEAAAAHDAILRQVRSARPDARISGVLVTPMVEGVAELILGARMDPTFGPVVMVGFGGVLTEVVRDAALHIGPVDEAGALAMLRSLKAYPLLDGARGRPKADIEAAAVAIARFSLYAAANAGRFETIEINPLLVLPAGGGVLMLDAAIMPPSGAEPGR